MPAAELAVAAGGRGRTRAWRPDRVAWWFSAPTVLLMVATLILPVAAVLVLSFTSYQMGDVDFSWVGLANYLALWRSGEFLASIAKTLLYVLMVVPASVIAGLVLALLVNAVTMGRRLYQCLFFLPVTSTLIAMATVWKYLLHGSIGPVNEALHWLGLGKIEFFGDPHWAMFALALIGVWQMAGFNMVLFLAGLAGIPRELEEAAALDGADRPLDRLFTVVLPLLGPTTLFVGVTSSITAFKVFDTVAVLTRGGPQSATDVMLFHIYREGFDSFNLGSASAMTMVFLVIIVAVSWLKTRIAESKVHYQ